MNKEIKILVEDQLIPIVTGKGQVYLVNKFLKEYISK